MDLSSFEAIIVLDFEFNFIAHDGDRPDIGGRPIPVCMCAIELRTGTRWTLGRDELLGRKSPPFPINDRTLFVCFVASAEMTCFRVLGWPMPRHVLDLSPEFRAHVSGLYVPEGRGLIGALSYFDLAGRMPVVEKDATRDRILAGGPFSAEDRADFETYCMADTEGTGALLFAMWPIIKDKWPYAMLRGTYTAFAQSFMEFTGIPIDRKAFDLLTENWEAIDDALIARVDRDFGVFEDGSFSEELFEACLMRLGIAWPRLRSGRLELNDRIFRSMAKVYPIISPIRELRHALSAMRLRAIAVGAEPLLDEEE